MARPLIVTADRWRDGVKFLMGLGTGPALTTKDQRLLRECLRGPFANGMKEEDALRVLRNVLGWEKNHAM